MYTAAMFSSERYRKIVRKLLPGRVDRRLRLLWQSGRRTVVSRARFGNLRRTKPFSSDFGYDRGQPIDRYYIENFLARHADDIQGRVLEIKDNTYTRKYGGDSVHTSDILDMDESNRQATIVADLTRADHVPPETFDCIVFTQTLQLIYEMRAATESLYRLLKPGGVLLATFPGASQISYKHCGDSWHWAFTRLSAGQLFSETFPAENVEVHAHGNVLVAVALLHGLAVEELRKEELDYHDANYEVLITLRAAKPESDV